MKILYLDTSSSFLYCGLVEDDKLIFEIKENYEKNLSKYTLFRIQQQFEENKISPDSVEKIILVNGPGSFTGIRIAVTISKVYAWALKIPIITISSLDAMAVSSDFETEYIVPLIDARRGYVYGAIYDKNLDTVLENKYISLDELNKILASCGKNYTFISNDKFDFDTDKYSPNIIKIVNKFKNKKETSPHMVNANYLKLTEAEEKNDKRG